MPVYALRSPPLPIQPRNLGMGVLCVVAANTSIGEATYESPTEYSQRSSDESGAVQEFMDVIKSKSCGTLDMTEWAQRANEDHQIIDGLEVLASDAAPALRNIYSIVESVVSNPELNDPSKQEAIKTAIEFLNFPMIMNNTIAILQKANFPQVFLPQAMSHVFAKLDKHCWSSIRDLVEPDSEVYKNLEAERESFMRSMRVTVDDAASEDTEKLLSKQQASFSRLDTPIEECFGLLHSVDNVKTALLAEVISNLQELCSWKKETSELPGNTDQRTTSQWKRLHEFLSCPFDISVDLADDAGKRDKAAVMNHRIIWMHNHCWDEIRELIHSWNPEAWAAIEMKEDILVKLASGTPPEEVTKIYKAKGTRVVIPKSLKTKTIMSNVKAGNMRGAISSLWSGDVGAETFEQKLQKIVRLVSPEVRKAATESKSTLGASLSEKLINTPNVEGVSTASTETTGASPLSGQSTEIDFLHLANSLLPVNPFAAGVMGFLLSETRDVLRGISWQDTASPADRRAITDMFNAPVLITQALSEKPNLTREEQSDLMVEVLSGLYDASSSAVKNVVKEAAVKGADRKLAAMNSVRSLMLNTNGLSDNSAGSNSLMSWLLASLGVAGSLAGAAAAPQPGSTLRLVDGTNYEELCARFRPGKNQVYFMSGSTRLLYCSNNVKGLDRQKVQKLVPPPPGGNAFINKFLNMMRPCYDLKTRFDEDAFRARPSAAGIVYDTEGKVVDADPIFKAHQSAVEGLGDLSCGKVWRKKWIDSRQDIVADVCAKANANSEFRKDFNVIINARTLCKNEASPATCSFIYCLDPEKKNVSEIAQLEDEKEAHIRQAHCIGKSSTGAGSANVVMKAKLQVDAKTKDVLLSTPGKSRIPVPTVVGNCETTTLPVEPPPATTASSLISLSPTPDEPGPPDELTPASSSAEKVTTPQTAGAAAAFKRPRTLRLVDRTAYEELCAMFTPGRNRVYVMPDSNRLLYCSHDLKGWDRLQVRYIVPKSCDPRASDRICQGEFQDMMRPCYKPPKTVNQPASSVHPAIATVVYGPKGNFITADPIFQEHKSAVEGLGDLSCERIWRKRWIDGRQEVVADNCAKAYANNKFQKDFNDFVIINRHTECKDEPNPAACSFSYCLDPRSQNVSEIAALTQDRIEAYALQDHCPREKFTGSGSPYGILRAKLRVDAKTKEVSVHTPDAPRIPVPTVIGNCGIAEVIPSVETVTTPKSRVEDFKFIRTPGSEIVSARERMKEGAATIKDPPPATTEASLISLSPTETLTGRLLEDNPINSARSRQLKIVDDAAYQKLCSTLRPGSNQLYYLQGTEALLYCGHKTAESADRASLGKIVATTSSKHGREIVNEPEAFLKDLENCPGLPSDPRVNEVEIEYDEKGNAVAYGDLMTDHREWLAKRNASRPESYRTGNYNCGAAWRNEWSNERDGILASICSTAAPNLAASKAHETKVVINAAPHCQDPKTKQDCAFVYCLDSDTRDASIIASEVEHPERALSLQEKCEEKEFGGQRIPAEVAVADVTVDGRTRDIVMFTEKSKRYRLPTKVGHCPKLVDIRGSFRSKPSSQFLKLLQRKGEHGNNGVQDHPSPVVLAAADGEQSGSAVKTLPSKATQQSHTTLSMSVEAMESQGRNNQSMPMEPNSTFKPDDSDIELPAHTTPPTHSLEEDYIYSAQDESTHHNFVNEEEIASSGGAWTAAHTAGLVATGVVGIGVTTCGAVGCQKRSKRRLQRAATEGHEDQESLELAPLALPQETRP